MTKLSIIGLAAATLGCLFAAGTAQAVDVLVSGQDLVLVIDVDGDGPDEVEDCRYTATLVGSKYTVTPVQNPPTLRGCTGNIVLDLASEGQDDSSDWAEFDTRPSGMAASGGSPMFPALIGYVDNSYEIEIIDESGSPDGRPFDVNWIRFEDPPGGDNVKSEVFICDNNGPVLAIEVLKDLLTAHAPFLPYPNAQSPEFMSIRSAPFELAPPNEGTIVNHDIYIPVTEDGHFTVASATTPGNLFIDIDFNDLTDCSRLTNLEPPEKQIQIVDAMSDAWFNRLTDGQGFMIVVWEDIKFMFLAWFTFDSERPPEGAKAIFGAAGQRWVTASGNYDGDTATLNVYLSSGGVLNMAEPKIVTDQEPIGTIVIRWTSCNSGTLTYNFPALGLMGEIPIERIVTSKVLDCQKAQPW